MAHTNQRTHTAARFARIADIRGANVVNLRNEELGTITDVVVDMEKGVTPYAVVSFGGILGINRDSIAVPMEAFQPDGDIGRFVLDTTREKLESAPSLDPKNWAELHDEVWREGVSKSFGHPRGHAGADALRGPLGHGGSSDGAARYMLSTDIEGTTIVDSLGETAGKVGDLITDRDTGEHVGFVLMKSGGIAGFGGSSVAVPWTALQPTRDSDFRISIPKDRIEHAPKVEKDEIDRLADPQFCNTVCSFFGVEPMAGASRESRAGGPVLTL